ncbi:MAG: Ni-sirohydrochlorin a,c-diamide synthase [Methanospirillum sp.]|uniref:Ni-sirohydrochlorin a,c-diamide synthase n=1 Tax=Methanospirillum sp. TaxID=45200 RepID=UPI0023752621|nr:Ni-sirohydrochlorin a,c-diamide synthase [Methanospirillum sp.]MDD1729444.1 Ni-sirohydrochlorin a,c-diamide synthase [Methanospirillum sp.]
MKTILITGDRSGSGKTSISVAIAALLSRTYQVQCFKVGMDYIDPSYLSAVTGRHCLNLDSFVLSPEENKEIFLHACSSPPADIALIEGVRGLFEGAESLSDIGSTASIAKLLKIPVILVIDARSITRSAAALLKGFSTFDPDITISGVILNNVRGESHIRKATEAIEHYCGIPVIGAIPRLENPPLKMRHLGLVPFLEGSPDHEFLTQITSMIELVGAQIDIDALLKIADDREIPPYTGSVFHPAETADIKIGIALDGAFNFYYADIFAILAAYGAEVIPFSPIRDTLPDVDGIIIGGGYPEYFGRELEGNAGMRKAIKEASEQGMPIYGECGGLMYLCDSIRFTQDWNNLAAGDEFRMCGVFSGTASIPSRRIVRYVIGRSSPGTPFGAQQFKGHAFHYSDVQLDADARYGYELERGVGIAGTKDGVISNNTLGSYTHLHPVAARKMLAAFCTVCRQRKFSSH